MIKNLIILSIVSLLTTQSYAGLFQIKNRNYGTINSTTVEGTAFQDTLDDLMNDVEIEVNKDLPDADAGTYLKSVSNSTATASRGLGIDFASEPDIFTVGYQLGAGADLGDRSLSDAIDGDVESNQVKGFGAATSATVGVHLGVFQLPKMGFFDPSKATAYVNFMSVNLPSIDSLTGDFTSFGAHLQYKIFDGINLMTLVKWGGIDVSTGFDYISMKLRLTKQFTETKSIATNVTGIGNTTINATYNGTAIVGADSSIKTIPINISTNLRLLYLFSFYGGLGSGLTFGSTKAAATVDGPVTITEQSNTLQNVSATASLDLGDKGKPTLLDLRYFAGLQLNFGPLKLYTQYTQSTNDTFGVTLGTRIAW